MFRSRILPAAIALWGAAIILRLMIVGSHGDGAYGAGQYVAGVLGAVMVVAGVRALRKST
jgi:peptidoglycan/LPS O-acetylase OafA/YrhL